MLFLFVLPFVALMNVFYLFLSVSENKKSHSRLPVNHQLIGEIVWGLNPVVQYVDEEPLNHSVNHGHNTVYSVNT